MRTPRQIWESERDDPLAWLCWTGGILAIALLVLIGRVVVLLNEPVGLEHLARECVKPYHDPRCVRASDFE